MKHLQWLILASGLVACLVLFLFPPWAGSISGMSYPRVSYRWAFAEAPVIRGLVYEVDVIRLESRVLFTLALTTVCFLLVLVWRRFHHLCSPDA